MEKVYVPGEIVKRPEIYHEGWIDHNKDGIKDLYENPNIPIDDRVEDLLSKMTLEEKLQELRSSFSIEKLAGNYSVILRNLSPKEAIQKYNELQRRMIEDTRLGIPAIVHDECLHGCVAKESTQFPQAIALASTWDTELVYKIARIIGKEARARGIRQCLSPVADLSRDVRAGRTEETYGEDPYLASKLAFAYCKGLSEEGVIATPKHYIANFVGEGGRDSWEIHFSERILREIFLPVFSSCIKAGALSIMAAYNSIDGIPCNANSWLLTEILRWELGFRGFSVSDYGALDGLIYKHRVAESPEEGAKIALESGLDVELPEINIYGDPLLNAVKEGKVRTDVIDEAVRRVLFVKFTLGLFDNPYIDPQKAVEVIGNEDHIRLAYEAAKKSIVLLKNDNKILPIDRNKVKRIALIGPFSDELPLGGYSGVPKRTITPIDGVREKLHGLNIEIVQVKGCQHDIGSNLALSYRYLYIPSEPNKHGIEVEYYNNPELLERPIYTTTIRYSPGWAMRFDWGYESPHPKLPRTNYSLRMKAILRVPENGSYLFKLIASGGGARLWIDDKLLIDCWNSECYSYKTATIQLEEKKDYELRLEYKKTNYAYTYIVLNMDYASLTENMKKAIEVASSADIAIFFAGIVEGEDKDRAILRLPEPQERLINEILKVNPKLVVVLFTGSPVIGDWIYVVPALIEAWYPGQEGGRAIADVLFGDYNPSGRLPITWPRTEGQLPLYYNYKPSGRHNDYMNSPTLPLFPFGYGLSYTNFEYKNLKIEKLNDGIKIYIDVENVGDIEGEDVIQVYVRKLSSNIARPIRELKGFKKVLLKPKEKKSVDIIVPFDDLAYYDKSMRRVVEPGKYEVLVSKSADDVMLIGEFSIEDEIRSNIKIMLDSSKIIAKGKRRSVKITLVNDSPVSDLIPLTIYIDGKFIGSHRVYVYANESRDVEIKLPPDLASGEHLLKLIVNETSVEMHFRLE